jgi:hypothetical protein
MTKIDIDRLSEAELVDLHHRIAERLRFLEQMRAHARMLEFSIGDRVCFESGSHGLIEGILTRYNKRTVTVITDDRSNERHKVEIGPAQSKHRPAIGAAHLLLRTPRMCRVVARGATA